MTGHKEEMIGCTKYQAPTVQSSVTVSGYSLGSLDEDFMESEM